MVSGASCPISGEFVDSTSCRVAAVFTFLILVAALFSGAHWLLGLLALEFALRLALGLGKSPLGLLARAITRTYGLPQRMVDAAPKRFAAGIALTLAAVAFVAGMFVGSEPVFGALAGIFAICTAFEGVLGFCVGCKMYSLIPKRFIHLHRAKGVT